jgi:ribosomal protein S17E
MTEKQIAEELIKMEAKKLRDKISDYMARYSRHADPELLKLAISINKFISK